MVPDQEHAGDALFIDVNSSATPTCTYVPRQLSKEELLKLLPEKWITNYEQIHQARVQTTTAPDFIPHENGQVEVRFSQEKRNVFPTSYMVQPLKSKGTEHFQFDICDCHDCLEEAYKIEYEEDIPKKKRSQQKLKERYESGDPTIGLLVPTSKASLNLPPDLLKNQPQGECHIITPSPSTQEYEDEFPPLSPFEITQQRTKHDWKIKTPTTIGPTGQPAQIGPAECTLNWQSENAVAQNKVLKKILTQQSKMQGLHEELLRMVQARTPAQIHNVLASKEAEMKFLKTQLIDLVRKHKQQRMSMQIDDPWRLPTTPFVGTSFNPQPLALAPISQKTPSLSIWSKEQEKRKAKKSLPPQAFEKTVVASSSSQDDYYEDTSMVASSKQPTVLPIQKANPISSFLQSLTREETLPKAPCVAPVIATSSHVDNDLVEAFKHLFMIEPETTAPMDEEEVYEPEDEASRTTPQRRTTKAPKGDSKQTFTFDDIPPSQWRDRSMEMLAWCTAELQHYDIEMVVKRFLTRIQGRLRDWYMSLGEYRQIQLLQSPSPEALLHTIYAEFIGNPIEHTIRAREEFLKMKCCSFRLKDLETHYNNMSKRFYCLKGIDDTNLKQIKCKDNSSCECSRKKKSHFKKSHSSKKVFARRNLRKKKWKFIRKKSHKGRTTDRCFICNKKGHFAKDYRNRKKSQALIQALNQIEPVDISDLESLYSLDDEPSDEALCTIIYSEPSSDEESDTSMFDILHTLPNIRFAKEGLRYKSFLNPWSSVPKLYMATSVNTEVIKQQIIQTSCTSSHIEFLTKNKNPLWLNPSFFVSLPFKQNEDVNPTKANHPGMNPEHYQLAIKECTELVEQSIIEPTTSPWACEAFYVNKRSEQVRGKLRLVINYQPLNHFLADDKFPLPQKRSLFQSLANAKILSKFDLKAGLWQLGIQPEDRPKTAFCIPDHHYQWKVMPFGLKNAPSAFQKAMVKVFEPILNNTLVYIDDILLFSPDEESHIALLSKIHSIVQEYGIMLSEKKMEIGVTSINFLGMNISDGKYQP
ncbi:hypothetical protein OSB04_007313 [Centaurea solstitialis]|uniref:Reverse transcriptase domain-containing protein n=1 Tax=Centaurea solstitialis TaxID=347529 RepID=A0AA38TJN3_9ASTR|nr:hypothetical protein OSB04_007313 [Centaurea solstitialis]